jgi:hypothetical protein
MESYNSLSLYIKVMERVRSWETIITEMGNKMHGLAEFSGSNLEISIAEFNL